MDLLVIPDGNRRWAAKQGRDYEYGYSTLPKTIGMIVTTLTQMGIQKLYFWCNSLNNLERHPEQVRSFLTHYLEISEVLPQVRVHIRGNRTMFPDDFRSRFEALERQTSGNTAFDLYYFLNYSTQDDIRRAMEQSSPVTLDKVLERMDEPHNIDVILRTGGDFRLSGFVPLKSPNADVFFVPEYFPALTPQRIREAIAHSQNREIRNGF